MGHSAQHMKRENAQKVSPNSSAQASARVKKMCRRNFALGKVRHARASALTSHRSLRAPLLSHGATTCDIILQG